ncbi:SMI1/KNR4 family protein [Paenibacillus sp. 22594]|uniref:SMI1/KNR4 family protein n=1 Tax=Paenibacillus sp. 22594 TaxID=3453947 RepID=UPI003F87F123
MPLFNEKNESCLIEILKLHIPDVEDLLNPAAEEAEINHAESMMNCRFPDDFRQLYMKHNGEGEQVFGVMAGFSWMALQSVTASWRGRQNSGCDIISGKPDAVQEGEYRKGWVPFAEDGGGSFLVMDLEPGVKGSYGQIITLDRNSNISYVISESLGHFFEFIESGFSNGEINAIDEEEVILIHRKQGHLFDDMLALTTMEDEKNSLIPISGFWAEYFEDDHEGGYISAETLSKQRMVFIRPDLARKHGAVSLDILAHMPNLKELIIHADEIANYDVLKQLSGLTKLVIGGQSFKESDLEYLVSLEELRELTLVRLSLRDAHKLRDVKKLKYLSLSKIDSMDCKAIGALVNLTELSLEELEVGDLSYISNLKKLKKLELKKVTIPDLAFLKDLRNLTTFKTDRCVKDESKNTVLGELQKLEEFTYPVGDLTLFKNCTSLREIGVDASRFSGLEEISGCSITGITIFQATSEEHANSVVAEFNKYFNLQSYGWQVNW